ncbi:cation transporter [Phenylobacterium sp.]|uniref:cation transporter n=1 Tax=Phenylobacterium sp. TaxID=1871053 RepID=UPI00374CAA0A
MSGCGCGPTPADSGPQRRVLRIALILNLIMFGVGLVAGLIAQSTGLIADSLDMLGDASAYGLGLLALHRSPLFKANAARWSGSLLLLLGAGVLADVARRGLAGSSPESLVMIAVASVSLIVNATVLRLLTPFRSGEVHLRATWIFTRADVIANVAVIAAGLIVMLTHLIWIDLVVGAGIGLYVLKEALEILAESRAARAALDQGQAGDQ